MPVKMCTCAYVRMHVYMYMCGMCSNCLCDAEDIYVYFLVQWYM